MDALAFNNFLCASADDATIRLISGGVFQVNGVLTPQDVSDEFNQLIFCFDTFQTPSHEEVVGVDSWDPVLVSASNRQINVTCLTHVVNKPWGWGINMNRGVHNSAKTFGVRDSAGLINGCTCHWDP